MRLRNGAHSNNAHALSVRCAGTDNENKNSTYRIRILRLHLKGQRMGRFRLTRGAHESRRPDIIVMARVCELAVCAPLRWPTTVHLFDLTAAFMTAVCTRVGGYIEQPDGPETTPPCQELHHLTNTQ